MAHQPAQLHIFDDRILWASMGFEGGQTQRPAPALLLGTRAPLTLTLPDGACYRGQALLVAPRVSRRLDAADAGFCSINIDPTHPWAPRMRETLAGQSVCALDVARIRHLLAATDELITGARAGEAAYALSEELCRAVWDRPAEGRDPRIQLVAQQLQQDMPTRLPLERLAERCQLSASRLRHLFREQTGVPLRSYLLWLKMHKAAALFARDWSMTDVAAEIGFSDAPHLCRVFREYFSVNPSWLADIRQVRVRDCRTRPEPESA